MMISAIIDIESFITIANVLFSLHVNYHKSQYDLYFSRKSFASGYFIGSYFVLKFSAGTVVMQRILVLDIKFQT